jgi:uncharacterized protein (TIGR00251 family)
MVPEILENIAAGTVSFQVRVQPRSSKDEIAGVINGALKIRLQAPAVENRANEALVEFLAHLLKTPKSAVRILAGDRSRRKRIETCGRRSWMAGCFTIFAGATRSRKASCNFLRGCAHGVGITSCQPKGLRAN